MPTYRTTQYSVHATKFDTEQDACHAALIASTHLKGSLKPVEAAGGKWVVETVIKVNDRDFPGFLQLVN
jgi:hypothetical protein